jgi:hypothetical protein
MSSYFEAYESPSKHSFEKSENPQMYNRSLVEYQHVKPKRHTLGVVGGNEVYDIKGNRVDLESDLLGITRPNTWGTERKHLPSTNSDVIERNNPKNKIQVQATPIARQEYQMWSYPGVYAPLPIVKENCKLKNKY